MAESDKDLSAQVLAALERGQKIEAIKLLRELRGAGLERGQGFSRGLRNGSTDGRCIGDAVGQAWRYRLVAGFVRAGRCSRLVVWRVLAAVCCAVEVVG